MSRAISAVDAAVRPHKRHGVFAWIKSLLVALALLSCQTALAEPGIANQILQVTKSNYQVLKFYYQTGKSFAASGQVNSARQYFLSARLQATVMSSKLTQLQAENLDTLQRGLCTNCNQQQLANQYNSLAKSQAMLLDVYLSILYQTPTSQQQIVATDVSILQLDMDMLQLEQAMYAAQH